MKKLFIALLCVSLTGLCACGPVESPEGTTVSTTALGINAETTTKTKAEENSPYSNEIKTVIKAYGDSDFLKQVYYAFYDLDGNATEELLLGEGLGPVKLFNVYTIQNGVATRQEEFFIDTAESSPALLFRNGTIRVDSDSYDGEMSFGYYRFEDGELKRQTTLAEEHGQYYHYIKGNRTQLSKAKFERVQKEMEGDGQVVELDWKPLAEYGR
ncbi:MAG: hypothetical protein FWH42_06310 [Dehalococcoidia bacterium]|nr:hypothetical protein [Dehalococcoidia bacterium]